MTIHFLPNVTLQEETTVVDRINIKKHHSFYILTPNFNRKIAGINF